MRWTAFSVWWTGEAISTDKGGESISMEQDWVWLGRRHASCNHEALLRKTEYMEMKTTIRRLYRSLKLRKGQSLVEYSLILALIAIFAMVALRGVGKGVNTTLSAINSNLP